MTAPPTPGWTYFTNHAHVLICLAREPEMTMREVASMVGITERAVQRIVAELEECGVLQHQRRGRQNHYKIRGSAPLRHPVERHRKVRDLLNLLAVTGSAPRGQKRSS